MKSLYRFMAALMLVILLFNLSGCYGSFALTKKVYDWNGSLGNKWINTAVMWILMWIPVYEATGFIDLVILNSVEFWTGTNPVAMKEGIQDVRFAYSDNKTYKVTTTLNSINILQVSGPDIGKAITLNYIPENGNWTINDGTKKVVVANLDKSNLKLIHPNGEVKNMPYAW